MFLDLLGKGGNGGRQWVEVIEVIEEEEEEEDEEVCGGRCVEGTGAFGHLYSEIQCINKW